MDLQLTEVEDICVCMYVCIVFAVWLLQLDFVTINNTVKSSRILEYHKDLPIFQGISLFVLHVI